MDIIKNFLSANGFQLRSTTLNSPMVLTPSNDNDIVAVLEWDKSNTGLPTVSVYTIQVSESGVYNTEVSGNSGNNLSASTYSLKAGEINSIVNRLPNYACGQEISIDVRIKAKVGTSDNAFVQYSNPITIKVTPYSTAKPLLAFTTDASLAADSDKLASSSYLVSSDYQGFFFLTPGTYKFYKPNSCNGFTSPTEYGTNGSNSGALDASGATGFTVATAGHYLIKANLNETGTGAMTYSITQFNYPTNTFGIFGGATKSIGFSNTTPMIYDEASKTWSLTIELINGKKFGFKTGNGNSPLAILTGTGTGSAVTSPLTSIDPPFTNANYTDGSIKAPGDFVNNNTKTRYNVVVDVSKARNYSYSLTPNPN
ncbi:MAG: SusE domain-containing protein [Flavobacterium sp.]|nr:SusE domain-containing protein [Flavobacterium sp.]